MSDTFSKVEVITGVARRRRFSTELKLAVVAGTMQPGMSVSYVAHRHGLSPSFISLEAIDRRCSAVSRSIASCDFPYRIMSLQYFA